MHMLGSPAASLLTDHQAEHVYATTLPMLQTPYPRFTKLRACLFVHPAVCLTRAVVVVDAVQRQRRLINHVQPPGDRVVLHIQSLDQQATTDVRRPGRGAGEAKASGARVRCERWPSRCSAARMWRDQLRTAPPKPLQPPRLDSTKTKSTTAMQVAAAASQIALPTPHLLRQVAPGAAGQLLHELVDVTPGHQLISQLQQPIATGPWQGVRGIGGLWVGAVCSRR